MPNATLFRGAPGGLRSYARACNMDLRDGTIRPSPRLLRYRWAGVYARGQVVPRVMRATVSGVRRFYSATGRQAVHYGDGTQGRTETAAQITDLCMFEDGSGNTDLVVAMGSAAVIELLFDNTTDDAYAGLLTKAGPDLYGTTDGGTYSDWKVAKCPAGSTPQTAANWSAGEPVGSPEYAINSLSAIGLAPIVGKPEGLFYWNNVDSRYANVLKSLEYAAHADNGKGMFPGVGAVYYPTADGGLFRFDGFNAVDVSPRKFVNHHRDAPHLRSRITAGVEVGGWVYVATAPFEAALTNEMGLTCEIYEDGGYRAGDPGAYITDNKLSTETSLDGLGGSATEYLYIFASVPFNAVHFTVGTANTGNELLGTGSETITVGHYWDGDSWEGKGIADTTVGLNGYSLEQSGYVSWRGLDAHTTMKSTTVNGATGYAMRLTVGTTGFTAATITQIRIVPSRPATSSVSALAYTALDNAGATAHILAGRPAGDEWEWHDLYCIPVDGPIEAMGFGDVDTAQSEENRGPRLFMATPVERWIALMGQTARPTAPVYENDADGNIGTPLVYFLPTDLSDSKDDRSTERDAVRKFHVYGEYVDHSDKVTALMRWDHDPWAEAGTTITAPATIAITGPNEGLILETAIAYEDPDIELAGPQLTRVDVEFEPTAYPFDFRAQTDAATPEVE